MGFIMRYRSSFVAIVMYSSSALLLFSLTSSCQAIALVFAKIRMNTHLLLCLVSDSRGELTNWREAMSRKYSRFLL